MTERDPRTDDTEQPWLLTRETEGLDPDPIRKAAGPDWGEGGDEIEGTGETIDEADVERAEPEGNRER